MYNHTPYTVFNHPPYRYSHKPYRSVHAHTRVHTHVHTHVCTHLCTCMGTGLHAVHRRPVNNFAVSVLAFSPFQGWASHVSLLFCGLTGPKAFISSCFWYSYRNAWAPDAYHHIQFLMWAPESTLRTSGLSAAFCPLSHPVFTSMLTFKRILRVYWTIYLTHIIYNTWIINTITCWHRYQLLLN